MRRMLGEKNTGPGEGTHASEDFDTRGETEKAFNGVYDQLFDNGL